MYACVRERKREREREREREDRGRDRDGKRDAGAPTLVTGSARTHVHKIDQDGVGDRDR